MERDYGELEQFALDARKAERKIKTEEKVRTLKRDLVIGAIAIGAVYLEVNFSISSYLIKYANGIADALRTYF